MIISTGNRARLLATMQKTVYHTGDDGDSQYGIVPSYTVLTTGQYSSTTTVDTPHYAAATISFDHDTKTCADSASGLVTILTGDTIHVHGGANDGATFTVASGANAASFTVNESPTTEAAGSYITLCKETLPVNECVFDNNTGRMWRRYTTSGAKVGPASDGKLAWYDATLCFTLHPVDANLSMDAATKTLKIVGGAGEVSRYHVGDLLEFAGFSVGGAGKTNNRAGGYRVVSVTVNGADLDIVLWTGFVATPVVQTGTTINGNMVISGLSDTSKLRVGMAITGTGVGAASIIATIDSATQVTGTVNSTASGSVSVTFTTLATEAAGGSRSIKIVCRSGFAYLAACNATGVAGYSDWRMPYDIELFNLRDMEVNTGAPNTTAFPSWTVSDYFWTSGTLPGNATFAIVVSFLNGNQASRIKTLTLYAAPVRG